MVWKAHGVAAEPAPFLGRDAFSPHAREIRWAGVAVLPARVVHLAVATASLRAGLLGANELRRLTGVGRRRWRSTGARPEHSAQFLHSQRELIKVLNFLKMEPTKAKLAVEHERDRDLRFFGEP
jgi:hypothetical protein